MAAEQTEVDVDVVVAGSGAAGMTAALAAARHGLNVLVIEKTGHYGGSTARSGGGVWVPGNAVLARAGVRDTPEQARQYLAHVAGDGVEPDRQRAVLEHGPAMLALVREATPVDFAWVPNYSDYYPEAPGGLASGRTIEPVPFDGRVLGAELARLNPPYLPAPDGMAITAADYRWLSLGTRHPRAIWTTVKVTARLVRTKLLGRRTLSLGQALAAGLRAGLTSSDVPVWLDTPLTGLVIEDGRVTGVRAVSGGEPVTIRARKGVLLATGGFERNAAMRAQYQRQPIGTDWTVGSPGNTGDGIVAGQAAGAALDLMDDAWWGPSIPLTGGPFFCLAERSLPGCIMVNAAGQRFVNEAAPYVDAVHAMYDGHTDDKPHIPAWLITDQRYRNNYVFAGLPPRKPLPRRWYKAGAVFRADSLADLGAQIGIPAGALADTVRRFNEFARSGKDEEFGRGDSAYDRYYGDPRCRPNPNLAPLDKPPFYAIKIVPGDLGTKGGLRTDARARVLRQDGSPIPGLYAAGNASAAVMGHSYAGAGATIGPAMTFGYIAALDMAGSLTE
ncbi:MAG TPA: 3-oxosteroid 1-dehydrogenase [Streptosporangiaceae bacterium]|nr:3-oxosteroid 1-dehydrogenase [Streptosporangiaceae bacterium]